MCHYMYREIKIINTSHWCQHILKISGTRKTIRKLQLQQLREWLPATDLFVTVQNRNHSCQTMRVVNFNLFCLLPVEGSRAIHQWLLRKTRHMFQTTEWLCDSKYLKSNDNSVSEAFQVAWYCQTGQAFQVSKLSMIRDNIKSLQKFLKSQPKDCNKTFQWFMWWTILKEH